MQFNKKPTAEDELRRTGRAIGLQSVATGFDLLLISAMLGTGFFIQWAIWLVVIGAALHTLYSAAGDAVEWTKGKIPQNPLKRRKH
ncbi:MAG: hypothetical protein HWE26_13600 [Alteromonadaceae bacterium]|nr:hypothetical protein [Alteromonadaceae bacterium]